jgi:radical SAM protein with 4Fe4S-binding SPASM domain
LDGKSIPRRLSLLRSWHGGGPARGFSVTLEVAFRCNVRCVFCSRWSDPTDLSLDAIRDVAEDMATLGAGYVSLTGGDPFVRRDIREIIDAFAERSVTIHINTNGVVLTKFAEFLISRSRAIRGITVSIDSPHAVVHDEIRGVRGTFDRALAGMARIRQAIPVSLACTLNQKNLHEMEEYAEFAARHGYPFRFQPLHDDGENQLAPHEEGVEVEHAALGGLTERLETIAGGNRSFEMRQYERLFEPFFRDRNALNRLRCVTAARLIYFIDPQGDVYPCDTRRDVRLGNVYETRLAEIVDGASSDTWRRTCRDGANGCWCMYACVAPNNVRFQDLPLMPLTKKGWPLKRRWDRRVAEMSGDRRGWESLPDVSEPGPDPSPWPFVSMIVASFNGGEFLQKTLERLFAVDYPSSRRELVLVDDASTDGSIEAVERRFADELHAGSLRVIRNPESLGVAGAYNRGVQAANPEARYLLKVDNDLLAEPDALREMVRLAEANPRAGIVGGRIHFHAAPGRIQFIGGNLASAWRGPALMHTPHDLAADPKGASPRYLDVINSCLSLVRREMFERAGLYPEFYGRYEYEDYDFAFRVKKLGYGSLYCPTAVGFHAVSLTSATNDLSRARLRLRARNGTLFMSRFAPATWFARYLLYHLAKIPLDLVRHGHAPGTLLAGYREGIKAVLGKDFPVRYLPTRNDQERSSSTLQVVQSGSDGTAPELVRS